MRYYYLHKNKISSYEEELKDDEYLISDDESLLDTHYIKISESRAIDLHTLYLQLFEETLSMAKSKKLFELSLYDEYSSIINEFSINRKIYWFSKELRLTLKYAIEVYKENGNNSYPLWYDNEKLDIECTKLLDILKSVELYAIKCFNNTLQHYLNILKLTTIDDVKSYDFTTGYPEPLRFNTNEEVH